MNNLTGGVIGTGLSVACFLALTAGVQAQESTNLAPRAEEVLRAASQYLAETPQFTVRAEIWRERVMESGQKLQFTRSLQLHVKRPNRLRAEIHSPLTDRAFYYDGKSLIILDRKHNVFSSAPMPENLDATLDAAHDQFGIDLPLIDLAVSDPYKSATARVETGRYYGVASVLGFQCHHLAFTQANIDWQLWVEDGPRPLIRKILITHKNDPGSPEFIALITEWNLSDRISESDFVFVAPVGASKIEMRPADSSSSGKQSSSTTSQPAP